MALSLNACQSPPKKAAPPEPVEQLTPYESALRQAENSPIDQQSYWLLNAMEIALEVGNYEEAKAAAKRLNPTLLSIREAERFTEISNALEDLSGTQTWSDDKLLSLTEEQIKKLPIPLKTQARLLQAEKLTQQGQIGDAIALRVSINGLLDNNQALSNHDEIWRLLKTLPPKERTRLQIEASAQGDQDLEKWLFLAETLQQSGHSLDAQLEALANWINQNPTHRASELLPRELALLQRLPSYRPERIALLLPQSGPAARAANALRDGFIAAYLASGEQSYDPPQIDLIDSSEGNITDLMLALQVKNYDLIVGPLEKHRVDELTAMPKMSPPVLALNYASSATNLQNITPGNAHSPLETDTRELFQFGLSSEDEVDQILSSLSRQGLKNLLVLASDKSWSQRLVRHLSEEAKQYDINLIAEKYPILGDTVSDSIAEALNINESHHRSRTLGYLIGKVDYQPRRRQDIDAVLLLSSPVLARQIKPLLTFHYAADLPVYGTSQVYGGNQSPGEDADLNGLIITTPPWSLQRSNELKETARQFYAAPFLPFFAMGSDAFYLSTRLALMSAFPGSLYQGQTGDLNMVAGGQIRRTLEWAEFKQGTLNARPAPDHEYTETP